MLPNVNDQVKRFLQPKLVKMDLGKGNKRTSPA
jgi:hypothetical protein